MKMCGFLAVSEELLLVPREVEGGLMGRQQESSFATHAVNW